MERDAPAMGACQRPRHRERGRDRLRACRPSKPKCTRRADCPLIRLHTQTALTPGQSITRRGVTVRVLDPLTGGFRVSINDLTVSGGLLRYVDLTDQGTVGHSDPIMIGGGGWQAFKFLLAGDNGVIYAVNAAGQLLRYVDLTDQGTVGHSDPIMIGGGGWQGSSSCSRGITGSSTR